MASWTFVRHGLTLHNSRGLLNGWYDTHLLPEGILQARMAASTLGGRSYQRILSSDLKRATQSAVIMARQAGWPSPRDEPDTWDFSSALRERKLGSWQGTSLREIRESGRSDQLISWTGSPPGGESLLEVARRTVAYLAEQPTSPTLVVSHAGPIRVLLGLLDGIPLEDIGRQKVNMAFPYHRDISAGRWEEILQGIT